MTSAVISYKGGTGKTMVSCNIASCLAHSAKTLLIDFDTLSGNISRFFNVNSSRTINDYLKNECNLEETIIEIGKNLDLICAEGEPELIYKGQKIWLSFLQKILVDLRELSNRRNYRYIIIDNQPAIAHSSVTALALSDKAILVSRADRFSLEEIERILTNDVFREFLGGKKRHLVLNMTFDNQQTTIDDFREEMKEQVQLSGQIPCSLDILSGEKIAGDLVNDIPDHPYSKAISAITAAIFADDVLET